MQIPHAGCANGLNKKMKKKKEKKKKKKKENEQKCSVAMWAVVPYFCITILYIAKVIALSARKPFSRWKYCKVRGVSVLQVYQKIRYCHQ